MHDINNNKNKKKRTKINKSTKDINLTNVFNFKGESHYYWQ